MRPTLPAALALFLLLLIAAPAALAQPGGPRDPGVRDVTRTFAITNATVVVSPERTLQRATVIIRDGLIEAVGPDVRIPFDADVIVGDSLFVYAGFIDALGSAGLDVPPVDASERVADPANPPRDRAGILPDRLARHHLDPQHGSVKALRDIGFGVAHVAPESGLLSGQSAVILLAGDRPEDMVLRRDVALVARFQGGSGVYPATPMGVAATLRQVYRAAAQAAGVAERYEADPVARRRPAYDPVSDALRASLNRRQPVYFAVDGPLETHRALRLARELDIDVVIAGLPESSTVTDRLREDRIRVLAPLALPDAVEPDTTLLPADREQQLADHIAGEFFVTDHRTRSHLDVEGEVDVMRQRQRIAAGLFERNPATLAEAGVPFAFASLGESPGDFRANLRRMIEAGLAPSAALAALTTTPAEFLGLSRSLGTVEAGKVANLVLTNADYFGEDARIHFVFVDGRRFEIDATPAAEEDPDAEVSVLGAWDYTIEMPGMSIGGRMTIAGTADAPTITIQIPDFGTLTADDVRVAGNRLSFVLPGTPVGNVDVSGLVVGDTYEAEVSAPGSPSMTLSATRRPN